MKKKTKSFIIAIIHVFLVAVLFQRDRWFVKSKPKAVRDASYPGIEISLQEFCSMFGAPYRLYRTATIIKAQLYNLGIASELYREFDALMKEKNVLSIDDSNTILKDIISEQ